MALQIHYRVRDENIDSNYKPPNINFKYKKIMVILKESSNKFQKCLLSF